MAKVIRRSIGPDGKIVGAFNENPMLNTLVYDVEFPDGTVKQYAANVIAENVLSQVDSEGHHNQTLDRIIPHEKWEMLFL